MVLNIKKLEHAVSHSDTGTKLPPESPLAKSKPTSPHPSLGTRIVSIFLPYSTGTGKLIRGICDEDSRQAPQDKSV